ncbi:MAG TPA: sigma-54 dependent transcriptional regulator [Chitinispirillaceae bacterium]|nr:sigma-54 dependent transcriptional regulator [Chitinispirillaceae bacterium]
MVKKRILVVDDNELFRDSVIETLNRQGYDTDAAVNGLDALEKLPNSRYDLVISDMKMPRMSGIELLEKIKNIDPDIPFLIITAYGAIETAVEAMKKGAFDFIQKSDNLIRELEMAVERALQYHRLVNENKRLKKALRNQCDFIGESKSLSEVRKVIESVAESKSTVLITGESGTGKELVARSIHYSSRRSNGPFIKVNCAALPEGLIESELFGHEKGAFTGAIKQKKGKFEAASGGTLLLDEIGEMAAIAQAKLLRVLQEREIEKIGSEETIEIDVRVIATTNRQLQQEVSNGRFREDLFYRLNVFHIHLPPLRERKDDLENLLMFFIEKYNDENGFSVEGVESDCLRLLQNYNWPGNIRELENAVERAVVLTRTGLIKPGLFEFSEIDVNNTDNSNGFQPGMTVSDMEKQLIYKTLEYCNQNRTRAAEMLGISIRTLRNKLHEYENQFVAQ